MVLYIFFQKKKSIRKKKRAAQFVACKTKVAPIKSISIPQLELCACVLLANLFSSIVSAFQGVIRISQMFCWSDSLDSLFWIKEEHKKRNVFVENRVRRIREVVPSHCWRHWPGNLNPADFPSRGCENYISDVINEKLMNWLEGPGFMYESQGQWPKDISSKDGYVCPNNYPHDEFNENHDKISLANVRNNVDIHGRFPKLI